MKAFRKSIYVSMAALSHLSLIGATTIFEIMHKDY